MAWLSCVSPFYILILYFSERTPGHVEDLTDLLLEDWAQLGSCREIGETTQCFLREEMERTWGDSKLAFFDDDEAQKWLVGVSTRFYSSNFEPVP